MMRCHLVGMDAAAAAAAIIATTSPTWFDCDSPWDSQGLILFIVGTVPDSAAVSGVRFPVV